MHSLFIVRQGQLSCLSQLQSGQRLELHAATRELSQGRGPLGGERVDQLSTDDVETLCAGSASWLLASAGRCSFSADVSQQAFLEQCSYTARKNCSRLLRHVSSDLILWEDDLLHDLPVDLAVVPL